MYVPQTFAEWYVLGVLTGLPLGLLIRWWVGSRRGDMMKRKTLLLIAALAALVGSLALAGEAAARPDSEAAVSQSSPYDTPLPAYDVCGINMPHISVDYMESYYKSTTGDPHYSCIARHPQSGTDGTHYYIVCHDKYANRWWWVPGVAAWLSGDCDG